MVNDQFYRSLLKAAACLFYCMIFICIYTGCSLKETPDQEIVYKKQKNTILKSINDLYPDRFKAIHRVILTFSKKNYVLNGYLSVNRSNREIRLIVQNDLGGIIFDVYYIENTVQQIHNNLKLIKNEWLRQSLLRDIKTLYLLKSCSSETLFLDQQGNFILSREQGMLTEELIFKPVKAQTRYQLHGIRHLKNGKPVYKVDFEYGTNGESYYPEFILIKDTKMRYSLRINIQYLM
jgi:hypothetical protein